MIATAEEIRNTEEAFRRVRADSRFGWEPELQYFYRPLDVLERLISLDAVIDEPVERAPHPNPLPIGWGEGTVQEGFRRR